MINPGTITVELLVGDPVLYLILTVAAALLIGMVSAYVADRLADEAAKEAARKLNPTADTTNIYDLENGHITSVIAGALVVIGVVLPLMSTIDQVGGFFGILAAAVGAGLGARKILPAIQEAFVSKVTQKQ